MTIALSYAIISFVPLRMQIRKNVTTRVQEAVKALSLCHNVTPMAEEVDSGPAVVNGDIEMAEQGESAKVNYQASSPDEVLTSFYT